MKRLLVLLLVVGPVMAQSPAPEAAGMMELQQLEADRLRIDRQLAELKRAGAKEGSAVLAELVAKREELERREEVAEARRTLPEIQARASAAPGADVQLELAAAHVVLEEFPAALKAAQGALSVAPKDAVAGMIVDELTRPEPRAPGLVRTIITMRWLKIVNAARSAR